MCAHIDRMYICVGAVCVSVLACAIVRWYAYGAAVRQKIFEIRKAKKQLL